MTVNFTAFYAADAANGYEELFSNMEDGDLLDVKVASYLQDGDTDTLSNLAEYLLDSDPCNPDTDGGCENDGSEVGAGRNPLDPGDDATGGTPMDLNFPITADVLSCVMTCLGEIVTICPQRTCSSGAGPTGR